MHDEPGTRFISVLQSPVSILSYNSGEFSKQANRSGLDKLNIQTNKILYRTVLTQWLPSYVTCQRNDGRCALLRHQTLQRAYFVIRAPFDAYFYGLDSGQTISRNRNSVPPPMMVVKIDQANRIKCSQDAAL